MNFKHFPQICPAGHRQSLPYASSAQSWCEQCNAFAQFAPVSAPQPTPEEREAEKGHIAAHIAKRMREYEVTFQQARQGAIVPLKADPKTELERAVVQRLRNGGFPERHIARLKTMDKPGRESARKVQEILQATPGPAAVLLWGDYGYGKTQIATTVAMIRAEAGHKTRYVSAPELLRELRDCMRTKTSEASVLRRFIDAPGLVIDDMHSALDDSPDNAAWARSQLQYLVDARYHSNADRKTIVIMNANGEPELQKRIGGQMLSRINEIGKTLRLSNKDYRKP